MYNFLSFADDTDSGGDFSDPSVDPTIVAAAASAPVSQINPNTDPGLVNLPTGRTISLSEVTINDDNVTFSYGPLDVTPYLTFAQMSTYPSFNGNAFLDNVYVQSYTATNGVPPPPVGSTSVAANFVTGVGKTISSIGTDLKLGAGSITKTYLDFAIIGVVLYLAVTIGPKLVDKIPDKRKK